ncbi:MAG: PDC sensor domain-containing protein [Alphaproteobacteria bacterium]|nr:PDC sensor domain-containing protein [Alphaproteobacteria bacterium]
MKIIALSTALTLSIGLLPAHASDEDYKTFVQTKANVWMADPIVQSALAAANAAHADLTEPAILDLDTTWRTQIDAADKPLITQVLSSPVSDFLRSIVDGSEGLIAEIILMDDRGLNAGISGVTSDYWQGDEDKYQQTYAAGPAAINVSDVELDESTGVYVIQISMPVLDPTGAAIGAATFSLDAERL